MQMTVSLTFLSSAAGLMNSGVAERGCGPTVLARSALIGLTWQTDDRRCLRLMTVIQGALGLNGKCVLCEVKAHSLRCSPRRRRLRLELPPPPHATPPVAAAHCAQVNKQGKSLRQQIAFARARPALIFDNQNLSGVGGAGTECSSPLSAQWGG